MTEKQNKPAEIKTHILEPVERPSDKRKSRPHVQPKKNGHRQNYPLQKAKHAPIKRFNPRQHKQSLAEKLVKTFTSLISKGVKTILPWTFLSLLVFTIDTLLKKCDNYCHIVNFLKGWLWNLNILTEKNNWTLVCSVH